MTDENTRLPSDSVVEALKEARAIAHTASKGITMQRDWLLEKRDQFDATLQALAARDDVREEGDRRGRLATELAKRKLLDYPIGEIASDELWGCIDTALSQGDEQPDTDGLAALIRERVTDDLIEGVGFGTIQAQGKAMDLLSELRALAEGAGK